MAELTLAVLMAMTREAAVGMALPPDLYCRLVQAESDWDVLARNGNCYGLAQINRDAWEWWPEDPYDPKTNLGKGAWILAFNVNYRLERGDVGREAMLRAVASYTLGHAAVNRLIRKHGDGWRDALSPEVARYVRDVVGDYGLPKERRYEPE